MECPYCKKEMAKGGLPMAKKMRQRAERQGTGLMSLTGVKTQSTSPVFRGWRLCTL